MSVHALSSQTFPDSGVSMTISRFIKDKYEKLLCTMSVGMTSRRGQTLVEYSLLLVLIAVVVVFMIKNLGGTVNNTYSKINSSLPT